MVGASDGARDSVRAAALAAGLVSIGIAPVLLALGGAGFAASLSPLVVVALVAGACLLPLRTSAAFLLLAALALDRTTDAHARWHTPLALVGDLLHVNIDAVIPGARGFKLSGLEVVVLLLLGIAAYRRLVRSTTDGPRDWRMASVAWTIVLILLAAVAFVTARGLMKGGSTEVIIWQTRPFLQIALLFVFFHVAFDGQRDGELVARVVVAAAAVKAVLATWVYQTVRPLAWDLWGIAKWEYATNHGDSILFAVACIILLVDFAEHRDRKRFRRAAVILPVILTGMVCNTRRLGWVDLGLALGAIYVVSPLHGWRRSVTRGFLLAIPVVALFVAAGWNSNSAIFAPVRTFRSVGDAKVDGSTWWRDVENWNIAMSMREDPLLGLGFGREYNEYMKLPDISKAFPMYRAEPHNMVLGLALFGGVLGFTGIWALFATIAFLAVRSNFFARHPTERVVAMCSFATVIIVASQAYGDLGPFFPQFRLGASLALVFAGSLAAVTGAWPSRPVAGHRHRPGAGVPP